MKDIAREILNILSKIKLENYQDNQTILQEINKKLLENKIIFELIAQLKYFSPEKLINYKERACFWYNAFNFLILFTIFYNKWNINSKEDWKYFFQKVFFIIGKNNYSFNDMQYFLFNNNPLFFHSTYKCNEEIKKFRLVKANDAQIYEKKYILLYNPFMIYLPIKDFLKPIIFEVNNFETQLTKRMKTYLSNFLLVSPENNISLPEILDIYQPRFLYKEYKNFQNILIDEVYKLIEDKKYKGNVVRSIDWRLDFDILLNN